MSRKTNCDLKRARNFVVDHAVFVPFSMRFCHFDTYRMNGIFLLCHIDVSVVIKPVWFSSIKRIEWNAQKSQTCQNILSANGWWWKTEKCHGNPTYDDIDLLVYVYLLERHIIYLWARFNASTSRQACISVTCDFPPVFSFFFGSSPSPPSSSFELEQFLKMPRSNIFTPIAILDAVVGWKHTVNFYRYAVGCLHFCI